MKKSIEKKTRILLLALGITPNLIGYGYSASAICKLIEQRKARKKVSYCKLYEEVGKEFFSNGNRAERAIRNAIANTLPRNKVLREKLLNFKCNGKLTVSEFLSLCAEKLMMSDE